MPPKCLVILHPVGPENKCFIKNSKAILSWLLCELQFSGISIMFKNYFLEWFPLNPLWFILPYCFQEIYHRSILGFGF